MKTISTPFVYSTAYFQIQAAGGVEILFFVYEENKGRKQNFEYYASSMTHNLHVYCQQCQFNFSSITVTLTEVTHVVQAIRHYSNQYKPSAK